MQNSKVIDESELLLQAINTEFNEENDQYDETEDDFDINEEEIYDDGIKNSNHYDEYEDDLTDETSVETAQPNEIRHLFKDELEDSLEEIEDYDNLDD